MTEINPLLAFQTLYSPSTSQEKERANAYLETFQKSVSIIHEALLIYSWARVVANSSEPSETWGHLSGIGPEDLRGSNPSVKGLNLSSEFNIVDQVWLPSTVGVECKLTSYTTTQRPSDFLHRTKSYFFRNLRHDRYFGSAISLLEDGRRGCSKGSGWGGLYRSRYAQVRMFVAVFGCLAWNIWARGFGNLYSELVKRF